MLNVGSSFIVTGLAPLLIHVQSDETAANTDPFLFVTVGTEHSCIMLLEYFARYCFHGIIQD